LNIGESLEVPSFLYALGEFSTLSNTKIMTMGISEVGRILVPLMEGPEIVCTNNIYQKYEPFILVIHLWNVKQHGSHAKLVFVFHINDGINQR
jgi:hypothetical protein